jgi:hypothetical protein
VASLAVPSRVVSFGRPRWASLTAVFAGSRASNARWALASRFFVPATRLLWMCRIAWSTASALPAFALRCASLTRCALLMAREVVVGVNSGLALLARLVRDVSDSAALRLTYACAFCDDGRGFAAGRAGRRDAAHAAAAAGGRAGCRTHCPSAPRSRAAGLRLRAAGSATRAVGLVSGAGGRHQLGLGDRRSDTRDHRPSGARPTRRRYRSQRDRADAISDGLYPAAISAHRGTRQPARRTPHRAQR